jgi:hypothetical protein
MKQIRMLVPVALVALATPAWSATLTYPGAAPCNTTLQACITGAASGDVVEIATNAAIDEDLSINKSLTLRSAAGYTPTIGGGATLRNLNYGGLGVSGSAETLLIENLHFQRVTVHGFIYQASGHSITIRDNVFFLEIEHNNTPAIEIDTRVALTGVISGNRITSIGQGIRLWAITSALQVVDYTVERNIVDTSLPTQSNAGIYVDFRGQGSYTMRAFSNVIDRIGGCNCGGNAGLSLIVLDTPQVVASFTNNTVNGTQTANGFEFRVDDPAAALTINLFNNIATFGGRSGFDFTNLGGGPITLLADRNDSYGNANPDDFAGLPTGTVLSKNPQYVNAGAGDLRLQPTSPLINSGVDAPPGGTSALDAGGAARIQGVAIDIGAYEQAIRIAVVEPVPAVGPQGLAGLALLLLGAAGLVLRARRTGR